MLEKLYNMWYYGLTKQGGANMATVSFEQNVVEIRDKKKIAEVKAAMASDKKAFSDIKPSIDNTKEKEFVKKWLSR